MKGPNHPNNIIKDIIDIIFRYSHISKQQKLNKQYNNYFRLNYHEGSDTIHGLQYTNKQSNGYLVQYYNFRALTDNNWRGYRYIQNPSMKNHQVFVAYLPSNYF